MPATSAKQKKFMDAAAHNPEFAKKAGVPIGVAKEFSEASKGRSSQTRPDRQGVGKPKTDHGSMNLFNKGGNVMASKMNAGFMKMIADKKAAADKAPAKKMPAMKKGGMAMKKAAPKKMMKSGGKTC